MLKKMSLLVLVLICILSLTACGKKVCKRTICAGDMCKEIEVDCETLNINTTTSAPPPTDPVEQPNIDNLNNELSSESVPTITDVPELVEDSGFSYEGLLDVEQQALNVFQAIIDGDYEGLYHMFYMEDDTFVSVDDVITFFKISDFGAIKGKDIEILGVRTEDIGYSPHIYIDYKLSNQEFSENVFFVSMKLYKEKWKYVNDEFLGTEFSFKTNKGTIVEVDGKLIEPDSSNNYESFYVIKNISRVEHEFKYTYKDKVETKYIVPFQQAQNANMYFY